MGVVNVTPDSFYSGSRVPHVTQAVARALEMAQAGADILDIGGESTRPGATGVDDDEEWRRIGPVIEAIRDQTSLMISVDTRKASVAEKALAAGVDLVNDVSGLKDDAMAKVVARAGAGLAIMHMRGEPETMQQRPSYDDVVSEVKTFLAEAVSKAETSGVAPDSILVDPGIGFGKTLEHNLALLANLAALGDISKPILIGTSRKSFIGALLDDEPERRLFGTAGSVAAAILNGAHAVRVHDVVEMRDVARVVDAIRRQAGDARDLERTEVAP